MDRQIVPATRLGLVLSISGFAMLAVISTSSAAVTAIGATYSLPWILLVMAIVYLPRLITPGPGWTRERCRQRPAAAVFVGAAFTAIVGTFLAASLGPGPAIAASVVTLLLAVSACFLPPVVRASRPAPPA